MSYPIETTFATGATLYAVIHNPDGRIWNTTGGGSWEAFNAAHWAQYAVALTEQGVSCYYRSAYPAGIVNVLTTEAIYSQAGGSPNIADGPPIGIAQSQGAAVAAIFDSVVNAKNFAAAVGSEQRGVVVSNAGPSLTTLITDLTDTEDDVYIGRSIIFTSGVAIRQASRITAYVADTAALTFDPIATAPAAADEFIIV